MKEELHIFVFMILLACSFAVALGSPPSKCSPVGKWQISISEQMRSELTFLATNTLRMRQVIFSCVLTFMGRWDMTSDNHLSLRFESISVGKGCTEAQKKAASKPADRQNAPISYSENCESMTFANRTWQKREDSHLSLVVDLIADAFSKPENGNWLVEEVAEDFHTIGYLHPVAKHHLPIDDEEARSLLESDLTQKLKWISVDSDWAKLLFAILNQFTFRNEDAIKAEFLSAISHNDIRIAFEAAKDVLRKSLLLRKFVDEKRVSIDDLIANLQTEFLSRSANENSVSKRDEL